MNRLILLLVGALMVGCSTTRHPTTAASPGARWIRTELFFGLSKPDGSIIAAEDWNTFLDGQILRRFPDGLTVLDATGRYLDQQQRTIKEPSKLVILFYSPDRASAANSNITAIVTEYCSQFHQESVLRADSVQKTSFPSPKKAN
jgi:uncharacterized protein DUF3574